MYSLAAEPASQDHCGEQAATSGLFGKRQLAPDQIGEHRLKREKNDKQYADKNPRTGFEQAGRQCIEVEAMFGKNIGIENEYAEAIGRENHANHHHEFSCAQRDQWQQQQEHGDNSQDREVADKCQHYIDIAEKIIRKFINPQVTLGDERKQCRVGNTEPTNPAQLLTTGWL